MANFKQPALQELDGRAQFANFIYQSLITNYAQGDGVFDYSEGSGNLKDFFIGIASEEGGDIEQAYIYLEDYVRNIYELNETQIPMSNLYRMVSGSPLDFGITQEEFQDDFEDTLEACVGYYYV